jgi:cobalt-zinc-cadmium efflux system membrane fusion protein
VIRRLVLVAMVFSACGRGASSDHAEAPTGQVPGVETAPATTESIRDVVRVPAVVAPGGLTPEARDARNERAAAEARLRLAAQQVARLRALAPGDVSPRKELDAAIAEEASARAAAEHARAVAEALGGAEDGGAEPGGVWLVARVPQESVGLVPAGAPAQFTPDLSGRTPVAATVAAAPSYIDAASRTAPVRVRAQDADGRLLPGMTGSLAIEVGAAHDAVIVPEAAIVYDDERTLVFVANGDAGFTETPVAIGVVRDGRAEVVHGVTAGARVATTGAASLLSARRLGAGAPD